MSIAEIAAIAAAVTCTEMPYPGMMPYLIPGERTVVTEWRFQDCHGDIDHALFHLEKHVVGGLLEQLSLETTSYMKMVHPLHCFLVDCYVRCQVVFVCDR